MKNIIIILIVIFIAGCVESENNDTFKINDIIQKDTIQTEQLINKEFAISERRIGYDNDLYVIRTTPFIDSLTNKYTVEILLRGEKDTIYVKTINKDTLLRSIDVLISIINEKKYPRSDTISIEELKKYSLVDVISQDGVRGYKTYLIAKFSKASLEDIFVSFEIKAFPYDGDIWASGFGYGGDSDHFNLIKEEITAHNNR